MIWKGMGRTTTPSGISFFNRGCPRPRPKAVPCGYPRSCSSHGLSEPWCSLRSCSSRPRSSWHCQEFSGGAHCFPGGTPSTPSTTAPSAHGRRRFDCPRRRHPAGFRKAWPVPSPWRSEDRSFSAGPSASILEALMLGALAALVFGRFCLGSFIFHLVRGQGEFARSTLPWQRGH